MNPRHQWVQGSPRHLNGWRRQKADHRDKVMQAPDSSIALSPSSNLIDVLDLRVEDQSNVGCCTAEGVTSACEAAIRAGEVFAGKEPSELQLSPLWLYAKSRIYEGTPLVEDSGCEIRDVIKVASDQGCALEADYPFNAENYWVEPPKELDIGAQKHRALFYYACDQDRATKASLIQGFPVICGFDVPDHMMSDEVAKTGLVHRALEGEGYAGGHCVLIVGHDDKKEIGPDTGGWFCLNSWSSSWALGGFFWLSYACKPRDRWTVRRVSL